MNVSETNKKRIVFFFLIGLTFIVSLPSIVVKNPFVSVDLVFHLNRILGVSTELSGNHFPVRVSSYWLNGYSYPASVFYGDILLYFPAVLHIIGVDVIQCFNIFIVFINLLTVVISYFCFKDVFKSRKTAMLLTSFYSTSVFRMSELYYRGAVGEFAAMAFLPLIMCALYRIYSCNENKLNTAVIFASGMTGVLANHIITFFLVIICIVFVCLLFIKDTFKWNTIKTYLLSAVFTIALSAYFIIPFLDYYISVDTMVSHVAGTGNSGLYYMSALIIDYFDFFGSSDRLTYSPGLFLMMSFLFSLIFIIYKKLKGKNIRVFILAAILLVISSNLFPWDYLISVSRVFRFVSLIQYPFRFLIIGMIVLTYLAGVLLNYLFSADNLLSEKKVSSANTSSPVNRVSSEKIFISMLVFAIILSGVYSIGYYSRNHLNERVDIDSMFIGAGREYLIFGSDEKDFDDSPIICDGRIDFLSQNGCHHEYNVIEYTDDTVVTLPVLDYKYYYVFDENNKTIDTFSSDHKLISFKLENGYRGKLVLDFKEPLFWRMGEAISVLTIILLIIGIKVSIWKRKKINPNYG